MFKYISGLIIFIILLMGCKQEGSSQRDLDKKQQDDVDVQMTDREQLSLSDEYISMLDFSQLISTKGNYIYVASIENKNWNISKYLMEKYKKTILMMIENSDTTKKVISNTMVKEDQASKIYKTKYPLSNILRLSANNNEEIYVEMVSNLQKKKSPELIKTPKIKRTDEPPEGYIELPKPVTENQEDGTTATQDVKKKPPLEPLDEEEIFDPENKATRYIYKFNKDGNFAYKIGINGKNSEPFKISDNIIELYCDQNNNLYVIIKDLQRNKMSEAHLGSNSFLIYRFDNTGKLVDKVSTDDIKLDFSDYKIANPMLVINEMKISPKDEKLYIFCSFYGKKYEITSKRLFEYKFADKSVSTTLTLSENTEKDENSEINYLNSFLSGITQDNLAFILCPEKTGLSYVFKVYDTDGKLQDEKKITLKNKSADWKGFKVTDLGKIIGIFTSSNNELMFHYY